MLTFAWILFLATISYLAYVNLYFKGDSFQKLRLQINQHVHNCNELNTHIEELKSTHTSFSAPDYGASELHDDSIFKMKRPTWRERIKSSHTHNCSLSVCRNAADQPFKYLCRYFHIPATEPTLAHLEETLNNFSAAEQGKLLLINERNDLVASISSAIPAVIIYFHKERVFRELGFNPIDLSDLHFPVYTFQYISAGGNSSTKCDIKLDIENLNKFVLYLSNIVKFKKSVKGQRALMTSALRELIKKRDGYACRICKLSTSDERNLLLEIDHIVPLSKGGLTSQENLQTLCWRCNRKKGAKILNS